uniref:Uncharacterized protein n=1 Tax=Anguilla anguilla TaxID=7936 RepID=A0A0E9RU05_ANGAN
MGRCRLSLVEAMLVSLIVIFMGIFIVFLSYF